MNDLNRSVFFRYAMQQCPREACALLVKTDKGELLHICENISEVDHQFVISPRDFVSASGKGEVIAVVHSHCFSPARPSDADKASCEATNLKWYICSVPNSSWCEFTPSGFKAPLIGRSWSHGVHDCYGLICDYYRQEFGAELPYHDREFGWWKNGENLYSKENWEQAGFFEVPLSDLKLHDGILMQIHSKVINHAGIYLGNNTFLHQPTGRLSGREVYGGYWRRHTVRAVRFGGKK